MEPTFRIAREYVIKKAGGETGEAIIAYWKKKLQGCRLPSSEDHPLPGYIGNKIVAFTSYP